jgi:endonuclease/exonuclease/phosphatase family metal-dependent hydrolase
LSTKIFIKAPPAGRTVNQIDHVLINKRRATIVEDVKTMRGANCDSDHFLIRTIIRQNIPHIPKETEV